MQILYNTFDFLITIIEAVILYLVASRFCEMPESKARKYFPFVFLVFSVYGLTWFGNLGEYKSLVITIYMALLFCVIYRITWIQAAITSMFSMTIIVSADSLGVVIASLFAPTEGIIVGDHMVMHWSVYLMVFLCKLVIIIFVYYLFRDFEVVFGWKDFLIVLFNFALVEFAFVFSNIEFFNRNVEHLNIVLEILLIVFSLGMLIPFFYFKNYFILRKKEHQNQLLISRMETQFAYYQDKQKEEEQIRRIYHDMKNHLLVLKSQIGDMEEANGTIESIQEEITGFENFYSSGNDFLDVILRDKSKRAKELRIDFNVNVNFEDGNFIDPLDVSTIFGNALDNAIEACEKLSENKRLMTVKASRNRDMLLIVVENNAGLTASADVGTTKQDTFMHGFGVLNIKKAVSKYEGQCITKVQDGVFSLKIMIPISKT